MSIPTPGTGRFEGKTVLLTGAAGGIGRACAQRFASEGALVGVADIDRNKARDIAQTVPGGLGMPFELDVLSPGSIEQAVNGLLETAGRLDALVNCAGVLSISMAKNIEPEEWNLVLGVNLTGTFYACRAVHGPMADGGGGRIVNLSSMAGRATSTTGGAHYTAAKAGVLGLTRHLAREWAPDRIAVNAVSPGMVDTAMVNSVLSKDAKAELEAKIPFGRFGHPEEIAALILFLVSEEASYITGANVDIHGGEIIIA